MFGLAPIKQEGMCSSFDYPEIKPWPGCGKEFNAYFKEKYGDLWYLKPVIWLLRKIERDAWDHALLENAKLAYPLPDNKGSGSQDNK